MDAPEPQSRLLGCEHVITEHADPAGGVVRRMEYNMQGYFERCLDRWTEVTGQPWRDLPSVSAPFLDEDTLRKNHGIGPLEFQLPEGKAKKVKPSKTQLPVQKDSISEPAPGKVEAGVLQPYAASILMQMIYGARYARADLLRALNGLARKITKWRPMQDHQLHRLVCHLKSSLSYRQFAWVGDSK